MRARDVLTLVAFVSLLGCQAIVDPGINYVPCVAPPGGQFVETFDVDEVHAGADRCWQTDHVAPPGYVESDKFGDLIIHPASGEGAQWTATEQAPFFFRTVTGNFLAVARAEAVSAITQGDHCGTSGERAGLAIRRREPLAWATWLVKANLPDHPTDSECADDLNPPPRARVKGEAYGFGSAPQDEMPEAGSDGEAYIALCRFEGELSYFYQAAEAPSAMPPSDFKPAFISQRLQVGRGPLDVGVTATADRGSGTQAEGHFDSLIVTEYVGTTLGDGCPKALEQFAYPVEK